MATTAAFSQTDDMTPFYDRDDITIYCGDCLEILPLLAPPFDAIIADLPYGQTANGWDKIIPIGPLWLEYKRLIKKNGAVILFGRQPFTSMLIMSNLEWFKYEWINKKSTATGQLNVNIQPMTAHDNIVVFGEGRITYNKQLAKKPLDLIRNPTRAGPSTNYGSQREYGRTIPLDQTVPTTVLEFNKEFGLHPTQKPLNLMRYLIRTYTNPGELILDNTMGSGTTLEAAQNEGRRAVGIEISEEYCKKARGRLKQQSIFSVVNGRDRT